jgi:hypothetical protein
MALDILLRKCDQKTFSELHLRDCALKNPRVKHESLTLLRLSRCDNLATLAIQSSSLETLELFDSDFESLDHQTQSMQETYR